MRRKGFGIMELVIVIVIIGALAGAVATNVMASREKAKESVAAEELSRVYDAVWRAVADGRLTYDDLPETPTPIQDLPVIMNAIAPGGKSDRAINIQDPWGHPYVIAKIAVTTPTPDPEPTPTP